MKFAVGGTSYDIDLDTLTMDEGEVVEDFARCTIAEFPDELKAVRVRAIRALVLIAKRRAGETVEWADLGSMDLMELALSIIDDNDVDLTGQDPAAVAALADLRAARQKAAKAAPKARKVS